MFRNRDKRRTAASLIALALFAGSVATINAAPVYAQEVPFCGPIDLAFLVDDTGSMGGAIANVQAELPGIIADAKAASGDDVRYALWTFKDSVERDTGDTFVDEATVTAAIGALAASGGAGEPEASDATKRDAVDVLDWADGRLKIAVLITDARPGGDGRDSPIDVVDAVDLDRMHFAAADAAAKPGEGIFMSDVLVPTFGDPVLGTAGTFVAATDLLSDLLTDNANTSGGVFRMVNPDGSGTGEAIREIIRLCGTPTPVGGELLSVDSAALFIAGATNMMWLLPVLGAIVGGAIAVSAYHRKETGH